MASIKERTLKSGAMRYDVIWRIPGDRTPKSITLNDRDSAVMMKTMLESNNHDIGRVNSIISQSKIAGPTVEELASTHIDLLTRPGGSTVRDYRGFVRNHLGFFAGMRAASITHDNMVGWIKWMESRGFSPKTISNVHGFLYGVFQTGIRKKILTEHPSQHIELPADDSAGDIAVFLEPHEYALIHEHTPEFWKTLTRTLLGTGGRFGEVTALFPEDITLRQGTSEVRISKAWKRNEQGQYYLGPPKHRSRRSASIDEELAEMLHDHIQEHKPAPGTLLFRREDGGRVNSQEYARKAWKPAVTAAQSGVVPYARLVKDPRVHDLRHTHISWLLSAGLPVIDVSRRVGHQSTDFTTRKYGHFMPRAQHAAAAAMTAIMRQG